MEQNPAPAIDTEHGTAPGDTAAPTNVPPPTVHELPLESVPGYPAFLRERSDEPGVLLNNPLADIGELRVLDRYTPEHREALVAAVRADLEGWDAPPSARDTAARLRAPGTYAVVTGQQAGIAGGPLYTLYKAIGAVRAAEALAAEHPEHDFVPVFWIEADDHDFDEARTLGLLDRAGAPVAVGYDDDDARPLHVGDRVISVVALGAFIESIRAALPATEFGEAAVQVLERSYGDPRASTLADGFARAMYAMLGDTPLVLVSSRNPALKRLAADVFAREAAEPGLLFGALGAATARLAGIGAPTPIEPREGSLFITHDGERRGLDFAGSYTIRGTQETMSPEQAAALARSAPERFSPKVALRPIVQDAILPTALYLGGPSELAYLRQVRDAYAVFGMQAPAIAPRPFVLLLEPKTRRTMESAGIALNELLAEDFDAASYYVDSEAEAAVDAARARALELIGRATDELREITERTDPTLTKALGAAEANASRAFEDHAKRLASAMRKKQATNIDRLKAARTSVAPFGAPQERSLSPLYAISRLGLERFRGALAAITTHSGVLQVLEL